VTAGSLPAGTTLDNANGYVFGTATATGAFSYTITLTDSDQQPQSASQTISGVIAAADPLTVYASPPSSFGAVGDFFIQSNSVAGGVRPYAFSLGSGSLPRGTVLDGGGTVIGTTTAVGAYNYTVMVTDSSVPPVTATSQPVSGTVTARVPFVWNSTPSAYLQVGQPYSQSNIATGPGYGYFYYLIYGSLPTGTTLENSTGLVSGIPTNAGPFEYTIALSAAGSSQSATPQTVSGTIAAAAPPLTFVLTLPTKAQVGQPYAQANTARGGTPAYTFTVPGGALPAGTQLDPATGLVSGTPTTVGSFSYTIAVIDSAGAPQTSSQTISGSIIPGIPALALASTPAPTLQVG
jgi:large repetitive protein